MVKYRNKFITQAQSSISITYSDTKEPILNASQPLKKSAFYTIFIQLKLEEYVCPLKMLSTQFVGAHRGSSPSTAMRGQFHQHENTDGV